MYWYILDLYILYISGYICKMSSTSKTSSDYFCRFNADWLKYDDWADWLSPVDGSPHQARCKACQKTLELSNMGRQSVKSHQKSVSHGKNLSFLKDKSIVSMGSFLTKTPCVAATSSGDNSASCSDVKTSVIEPYLKKESVDNAEILWGLRLVERHESFRSCDGISDTFSAMFPDSNIVKKFSFGRTKAQYVVNYGLAPFFHQELVDHAKKTSQLVVCFDEAFNRVVKKGQMDVAIRLWDVTRSQATSKYFSSAFLGHCTSSDLLMGLKDSLDEVNLTDIIQLSMDGPNVNWKLMRMFQEDDDFHVGGRSLLQLGSCGLHVVHGAFQKGHKDANWNVNEVLRGFHNIFKFSPARRSDFISHTGQTLFPLKFCQTRWVENSSVADRIADIYPSLQSYVKEFKLSDSVCSTVVKDAVNDPMTVPKITFFSHMAGILEPFLLAFQSPKPMVPFLYEDLGLLLKNLYGIILKSDVVEEADTPAKLMKVDIEANLCSTKSINLGVATSAALKKSSMSDLQQLRFRQDCKVFVKGTVDKIIERSPLKYPLTRAASSLSPSVICRSKKLAEQRMGQLVQQLYDSGHIKAKSADQAKIQFTRCLTTANFSTFNRSADRLDDFYTRHIGENCDFKDLFSVVKLVLILSHGNAFVESGFSVNDDLLVSNLHEESIIAQRQVFDSVKAAGGHLNVQITQQLRNFVRCSYAAYQKAANKKRACRSTEEQASVAKREAQTAIKELLKKKKKLMSDATSECSNLDATISELKEKL